MLSFAVAQSLWGCQKIVELLHQFPNIYRPPSLAKQGDNALGSVSPSVSPSVSTLTAEPFDLRP